MGVREYQAAIRQEKHTAIVAAALKNFKNKGYGLTSVGDIAVTSGVSLATLYKHYRTKDDIFEEAANLAWKDVAARYVLPDVRGMVLSDALKTVAQYYVATVHKSATRRLILLCMTPHGLPVQAGHYFYEAIIEPTRHYLQTIIQDHKLKIPQVEMQVRLFMGAINDMLIWPLMTLNLKEIPEESIDTVISYGIAAFEKHTR